jgi:hypothetical protein
MGLIRPIEAAWKDTDSQKFLLDHTNDIRGNWYEADRLVRRNLALLVVLAFAFELLTRGGVSELSVAFIKIRDLSLVQKLLPAVFAYVVIEGANALLEAAALREAHDAIIRMRWSVIHNWDLERLLWPPNSMVYSTAKYVYFLGSDTGLLGTGLIVGSAVRAVLVLLLPIAFTIYSCTRLFILYGLADVLTWFSVGVSVVALSYAVLVIATSLRMGGSPSSHKPVGRLVSGNSDDDDDDAVSN